MPREDGHLPQEGLTPAGGRLSELHGMPGISPQLLRLEERLLEWRETYASSIRPAYPRMRPKKEDLASALSGQSPLARRVSPLPEPQLLAGAIAGFLDAVSSAPGLADPLRRWPGGLLREGSGGGAPRPGRPQREDDELCSWFMAAWRGERGVMEEIAARNGIDPDLLEWAGRQLARPFFHRLGELLAGEGGPDPVARTRAGCPCCGGAPRLGRYDRSDGRRHLWCDLCDIEWVFPRITCPFCSNADHDALGYLTIEGVNGYRIDVCELCRGYLRSVDERVLADEGRVDFLRHDVGTFHLCLAAERDGWRRGEIAEDAGRESGRAET